jgi:hypothetical protein
MWRSRLGGLLRCGMCGADEEGTAARFDIDHVIPLEDGGPDEAWNTQPLCRDCHVVKGSMRAHRRHLAGLSARVVVDEHRSPEDWWPLVMAKLDNEQPHITAFLTHSRIRQVVVESPTSIRLVIVVPGSIGAQMLSREHEVACVRNAWRSVAGVDCEVVYEPNPDAGLVA